MHRFLIFAGICFWLVTLAGCGSDDATTVASNDGSSSEEGYTGGDSEEGYMGGDSEEGYMGGDSEEGYMGGDSEEGYMGGETEEGYMGGETEEGYMGGDSEEGYMGGDSEEDYMGGETEEGYMEEEYEEEYEEEEYMEEEYEEEEYDAEAEEGYMEEDYGDGEGYMGEGSDSSGDYQGGRPRNTEPPRPLTLADKSKAAFAGGREKDAFQYLFAHAVTADEAAAKELLDKMGLLASAKRPAMAVRWGIGVEYTAPKNYEGSAYPIGTNQQLNTGNRGGRGGYGEGGGGGYEEGGGGYGGEEFGGGMGAGPGTPGGPGGRGASGGAMDAQLKKLTGELGDRLVGGLRDRIAAGVFGKVLAEAMVGGRASRPGSGGPGYRGGGGGGYMGEDSEEEGYMEEGYGEEEEDYGEQAAPGEGYSGGYSGGYGQARQQQQPGAAGAEEPTQLMPGVVFLGVNDDKVLKQQAKDADLDVLVIFEVGLKFNVRQRTIINETTVAIYNMLDDKRAAHETKKINNIQVQVARDNNDKDVAAEEMEELFKYIDSTWLMTDLPNLSEQQILDRLRPIITERQENPLPILAEIRMYRTRGLLQEQNYAIACKSVVGDQLALTLATGTEEEKKAALAPWLPSEG